MPLPDYKGGSIVNLMSSLLTALGAESRSYAPLAQLAPERLTAARNIVLMVIDGLGYEYLLQRGVGGTLFRHLEARITSVFPPTTATAIATFLTGTAPQQHALTGWFIYFKELGTVTAVLPFKPRYGGTPFSEAGVDARTFFDQPSVFERIQARSYVVLPKRIVDSDYSRANSGRAERRGCKSLEEYFRCVHDILHEGEERKYVYAYWADLDGLAHVHGIESAEVATHFAEIDAGFADFLQSIRGTRTSVIVTADHGFVDSAPRELISLDDHPTLADTLTLPLCGDARTAYCYVHPGKRDVFEKYVETRLGHCATLMRSEELIEGGYFGLGQPHPRLADRVGHYALLMKQNYAIKDWVLGEHRFIPVGVHGALSKEELYVPRIVVQA
jgi:hypothetical protein